MLLLKNSLNKQKKINVVTLVFLLLFLISPAFAEETCMYTTSKGEMKVVTSRNKVPQRYKSKARCMKGSNKNSRHMARPEEFELDGNIRREDISTTLGRVKLKWPRRVEGLFGRSPMRAVTGAARAVGRVIRGVSFPSHLQNLDIDWNIVFIDTREKNTQTQIPAYLVQNCHPGWMTPPTNIYIVAQRVAGDCSINMGDSSTGRVSSNVADEELAEVLIHEMGHAIEYQLLQGKGQSRSRLQAEGFATWFEHYAADFTPLVNARKLNEERYSRTKLSIQHSPTFRFGRGDAADYSRASMYFSAIEDKRGARGIVEVYDTMVEKNLGFFSAIKESLGWDREKLEKEILRHVEKH